MSEQVFVKPAVEGTVIRDPHSKMALPASGMLVPKNNFWTRRIQFGEVVVVENPGNEKPKASKQPLKEGK